MEPRNLETVLTARPGMGQPPAVVMYDTKYPQNASRALRNCMAYDVPFLWITGERWLEGWKGKNGKPRPPREERMKAYGSVRLIRCDEPLRAFASADATPVAVEIDATAENIAFFEFPLNPVFVFGPEDGSLPDAAKRNSFRKLILPTRCCVNLADAVGQTLLTWHCWKLRNGLEEVRPSYAMLDEHRGFYDGDDVLT